MLLRCHYNHIKVASIRAHVAQTTNVKRRLLVTRLNASWRYWSCALIHNHRGSTEHDLSSTDAIRLL